MNKIDARHLMLNRINNITPQEQLLASHMLCKLLFDVLYKSNKIVVYHAFGQEISLDRFINKSLLSGKKLYRPVSYQKQKVMSLHELDKNYTGVFYSRLYHKYSENYLWQQMDAVLLPLIALDRQGHRVGRGHGYYDTTLRNIKLLSQKTKLYGIGYKFQLCDSLSFDDWDINIDYFVNESEVISLHG